MVEVAGPTAAHCAACRVPLTIPPRYRAAHVLCPSCQTQPKAPPANPYPVVTAHSTVAYTYPQLPASGSQAGGDSLRVCMRFGCGARLPPHAPGDKCGACVGVGFNVRPPLRGSALRIVERCVPRRTVDNARSRSRESLELVRDSLARETTFARPPPMDKKDIEEDMQLVYPDDIPVPAPRVFDTPSDEYRLAYDRNAELKLVYPEIPPSNHRTKLFAPTTLRELVTDGLQTIPVPKHLAVLAEKITLRRCRMPGCNEILPAKTCMERCVKCSISDWKRRKLASMDDCDSLQYPGTSSLTPVTNTEEGQVSTIFSDISDVEDEINVPPVTSSPGESSSSEQMNDRSVRLIPGWDSDLSELTESELESASDSDTDSDPHLTIPDGDMKGLKIRIPPLIYRLPPDGPLRKCGNKRCNIAVPKVHRWKTCDPCRRAQRLYQRARLENVRRGILGFEILSPDLSRRWRSLGPDPHDRETEATLTLETSRPCAVRHCRRRVPLPEVYRWKTCTQCRARARRDARRKRDERHAQQQQASRRDVFPRFLAYQNRGALLASFGAQLRGFVDGLIVYLRAKLGEYGRREGEVEVWKPEHAKMVFVFLGEYSVVAGQREGDGDCKDKDGDDRAHDDRHLAAHGHDPIELEGMRQEVSSIVQDLERVLDAEFRPREAFALDKGGMIMRFTCSLELVAQLRPIGLNSGSSASCRSDTDVCARRDQGGNDGQSEGKDAPPKPPPTPVPLVRTLSGELEAVVIPDESHSLFHGQRTVIRYCMLG